MSYRNDVAEVKRLTRQIDKGEADVESWKWSRAELLAAMADEGHRQQEIAADAGLNQATVARLVKLARQYADPHNRPTYAEAYQEVTGDTREHSLATSRIKTAAEAEERVREIAKRFPDAPLVVASEQAGQTRSKAPSNQAKVEQAFGPEEFNRLEYAIDAVAERLPDLAPNKDDRGYAEELAEKAEALAAMLRGWANGEDIGREAEEWLQAR